MAKATKKTAFPMTKDEFLKNAPPLNVTINGVPYIVPARQFSTGSVGYNVSGKIPVKVGDHQVTLQIGANCTAVGSKDAS